MGVAGAEWLFRFKAKTPFEEGLRRTIEWYEPVTGERLLVYSQEGTLLGDRILLGQMRVGE